MMIQVAAVGVGLVLVAAPQPSAPQHAEAATENLRPTIDLEGTVVPAEASEITLWLERYRGELLVLEAVSHGSFVNEGDVLIRFDTSAIDRQLRQAEFDLEQARRKLDHTEQEHRIQEEAAGDDLARAEKAAGWAARKLAGYLEQERPFKIEEIRLRNQSTQHGIEDQRDELEQLEQMYKEDELVDATEEIVLKRSRRRLATSLAWARLREQQNEYALAHTEAIKLEGLEQEAALKGAALDRQRRSAALGQEHRETALERARFELDQKHEDLEGLRRDRERLVARAPRRGLVLHGEVESAPGEGRLERGGRAGLHQVLLVVADPDRLRVVTEVPESSLFEAGSGTAAEVTLVADPDFKALGALEVTSLPTRRAGDGGNLYRAEIELDERDPRLRPGMRCRVSVLVDEAREVARAPKDTMTEPAEDGP
jgi:multidrug resistance efflux pump